MPEKVMEFLFKSNEKVTDFFLFKKCNNPASSFVGLLYNISDVKSWVILLDYHIL